MIEKKKKSKIEDKVIFSVRVPPRFHHAFRLEALKRKITMEDLLMLYQNAHMEKTEREKAKNKAEREGKSCESCGQLIIDYS